jgi:putative DNA primase/helicase
LTDEHKGYHLTEGGAGYRFADERGDDVLFCKTMNKWFIFDGSRFRIDTKNKIHTFVKQMVKKMWGELGEITDRRKRDIVFKYVKSLDNCAKVDNIVKFVSSEEKIAVDPEELDNDSTKIILINGVYDLNLSTLLPFSKEYKITKQTKSEYIENAKCEKWLQHLSLIFNNDKELIECFQIAIGFTFIEGNPDQVIFLAFGSGENGKSVTLDTLAKVLGDYAKITNFETFSIKSNTDPHSDIAALKAVRLCIAAEAKDDTKNKFNLKLLDTELIKKLSGGEPLKCRFLYGEWFDLFAEFKLWLMLNELPTITDNSHAMWRRLILFPFNVTIPPKQKMLDFDKILYREERAGILSWVLEGYKKYKTLGKLKTCAAMEIAKEDYHLEQDNILRFAKDVLFGHLESIKKKECYDAYKKWCLHEEVSAKGKQAFFKEIIKLNGVKEVKIMGEMKFQIKYNAQKELAKNGCIS